MMVFPAARTARTALSFSRRLPSQARCGFRSLTAVKQLAAASAVQPQEEIGPAFVRPLGSVEEMFAAYGEIGCVTYSMAARVKGDLNRERLEAGIDVLQRSNEHLSLTIRTDPSGRRYFARSTERIPLRIVDLATTGWEKAMENETTIPFPEDGTLIRVTALLGNEGEHVLLPTIHHSLADGLSGIAILKDLLLATSGHQPAMTGHGVAQTLEETFGPAFPETMKAVSSMPPPPFPPPRNNWAYKRDHNPTVQGRVLSKESTQRLIRRAKWENTTVYSALIAALARARYERRGEDTYPTPDGLRLLIPFNSRPYAPPTATVGLFIGAFVIAVPPPQLPTPEMFWTQARTSGQQVHSQKGRYNALGLACATALQMGHDASPEAVMQFMRVATDHEALLTNMGVLDIPEVCGGFEVKDVWAAGFKSCIQGEDNVGVGTFGGKLRLVHSSLDGTEGLLDGMVGILEENCK